MTLTFIQGHNSMRKQKLLDSFSCKFLSSIWMKFSMLPWSDSLSKLALNLVYKINNIQGRKLYLEDL